jgi:hypothetical protein
MGVSSGRRALVARLDGSLDRYRDSGQSRIRFVMPALVAGIHTSSAAQHSKTWMAGTSPAMT